MPSKPFLILMLAFAAVIVCALVLVGFNNIALIGVFGSMVLFIVLLGLVSKATRVTAPRALDIIYGVISQPIVTFLMVLIMSSMLLFVIGREVEQRLVIVGLVMFSAMLILFPQLVKRQVLIQLVGEQMPDVGYIVMGFTIYLVALVLNSTMIDKVDY
jgi:hypothetical protein